MTDKDGKSEKAEIQKRLDRISDMFADMIKHVDVVSRERCPYRDRHDNCTGAFTCRNQIAVDGDETRFTCDHGEGALDYRTAWESQPKSHDRAKRKIAEIRRDSAARRSAGDASSASEQALRIEMGRTVFDYADEMGMNVATSCGRTAQCHECVVEIRSGMEALTPRSEEEAFLRDNFRLACQALIVREDIDIDFAPLRREPRILVPDGSEQSVEIAPPVTRRDDEVLYDGEVVDRYRGALYGLAVDLGTTTVVMDLIDLVTGKSVAVSSFENPQRFGGSDVMNRISYDADPDSRGELKFAVVSAINREMRELARREKFPRQAIYEIVIAGNSTMRDILFGLDVQTIGQKPYKSSTEHEFLAGDRATTALLADAWGLGFRANRRTKLYGLPLIASHVGADAAACLVATDFMAAEGTVMLVDMGTNTEVVLRHEGKTYAASCPAGPAFEGGQVTHGMSAYDGAIESVRANDDGTTFDYHTIADAPAEGLCGSGLIDLLAELRRTDRLSEKGVFTDDRKRADIAVVPERNITLSRRDISNLAQAKAANYCGQLITLRTAGVTPEAVDTLYLAGGFAHYIDVPNAIAIGLIAPVSAEHIVKIGNAAIAGARAVLMSVPRRRALEAAVTEIQHIELETSADFFNLFVEGCQLKPMPADLQPRKRYRKTRQGRET